MVPPTRRRVLQGAAGLAAALTGCSGLTGGSDSSTSTATAGERDARGPGAGAATDPEMVRLRVDSERAPVWLASEDGEDRPDSSEERLHISSEVIDTTERADRVRVAQGAGRDRVQSFLDATDFETETLYLETNRVEECFELTLCHITWRPDDIQTDYGRTLRPYDEACANDNQVYEVRLIRIPAALDSDEIHSFGSSLGSGGCNPRPPGPEAESGGGEGDPSTPADSGDATSDGTTAEAGGEE